MGYIGNVPAEKYSALTQQTFSSPTGTSFTLDQSCTNSRDIALFIDNVRQNPASYTVSGTSLTTSTISSPSTMYCLFNGRTTETVNPPDDSVGTAKVSDNAITLAKMAGGTDGQIITYDASGDPVAVGPGTDGQVLTSTGAGSPPAFEDAGGGAWNLISSTSTSTTSEVEFTGLDTTYDTLALVISELVPTNDNKSLRLAFGDGSSYPSSSAKFCVHRWGIGETTPNYDDNSASAGDSFALTTGGVGDATGESCSGVWYIRGTSASSAYPTVHGESIIIEDGSGQGRNCSMIGQFTASTQLTKIKVWYLADTMATGRVALYRISNS